jgi:S1-C subfamily serine protease
VTKNFAGVLSCILAPAVLAVSGCSPHPHDKQPLPCPFADKHWTIDDKAAVRIIIPRMAQLYQDGKTTKMSTLIEQLGRKRCEVSLPKIGRRTLDPVGLYRRCREGVLVLAALRKGKKKNEWAVRRTSAFALTANGVIATCYHCVDDGEYLTLGAMTFDGKVYAVKEVLAANKDADVAILQLDASGLRPLPLRPYVPTGTEVYVLGHPGRLHYTFTGGTVSRRFYDYVAGRRVATLEVTARMAGGGSGSPVVDRTGAVVGVTSRVRRVCTVKGIGSDQKELAVMTIGCCAPAEAILACMGQPPGTEGD